MERIPSTILASLSLLSLLGLSGCGGDGDAPVAAASTTTAASTVTVNGSFDSSAGVRSVMLMDSNGTPTEVAVSNNAFTTSLPSGTYTVTALDAAGSPVGLLTAGGSTSISFAASTDLGALSVNTATHAMTSGASLTVKAVNAVRHGVRAIAGDFTDMVGIKAATGSGNGKDLSALTSGADTDGDGIPDFFDNDSNGNGVYDVTEVGDQSIYSFTAASGETLSRADFADTKLHVFDNLKLDIGEVLTGTASDNTPHTNSHVLAFHLSLPSAVVSKVATVKLGSTAVPYLTGATIAPSAGAWTFSSYPSGSWSANGYALATASLSGTTSWALWVKNTVDVDPTPGVVRVDVTLSSGSVLKVWTRVAYVFNTPPKITSISDTMTSASVVYPVTSGDVGSSGNPFPLSAGKDLTVVADRPLTVAGGTPVYGRSVRVDIFYYDATGAQINTPNQIAYPSNSGTKDVVFTSPLSLTIPASMLPTTYGGVTIKKYKVDMVSVGANNDNAALMFFAKPMPVVSN